MASLAWIFGKPQTAAAAQERHRHMPRTQTKENFMLRPVPNEDVHVFIKKIDNTRVVREQDPKANASAWKTISMTCLAAMMIVGLIVPIANSYLAGYMLTELEKQNHQLSTEVAKLQARESQLTSVDALARAAKNQVFLDPAPDRLVVLNGEKTGSVALNRK